MRRLLHVLLILFIAAHADAQPVQVAKFLNMAVIPKINHDGATSMQVKYAITFKYSRDDFYRAKDSSAKRYRVDVRLETEHGLVLAQDGYEGYVDSANTLAFADELLLYRDRYYAGQNVSIPLAALRLDTGKYKIRAVLRCYDQDHMAVSEEFRSEYVDFRMPPHQAVKLMVGDISVMHTDPSGEPWDYYPFNIRKALPDIFWLLSYGGTTIHTSETQWDSYEWRDSMGCGDYLFYIVKGDVLRLRVFDRDIYSPSDFIGATEIDTKTNCCNGKLQNRKFDRVLNMTYALSDSVDHRVSYPSIDTMPVQQR